MPAMPGRRALARELLIKRFERAGLGFKVLGGPLTNNREIFQMDINRTPKFGEYFRIWPGDGRNEIEVLDHDISFRQLVLRVQEERRRFVQFVNKRPWYGSEQIERDVVARGGRIVEDRGNVVEIELWTDSQERRYLCGMDDLHLFIAQIREGSTVREAHAALRPQIVKDADLRCPGRTVRQGEWFFIPPQREERAELDEHLAKNPGAVRSAPVGPTMSGRSHVADEVVNIRVPGRRGRTAAARERVYARGMVHHLDHRPVVLDTWRRVVLNDEVRASQDDRLRLRWID